MDVSNSLGIQKMPEGYGLMYDEGHYYWVNDKGDESTICWDKWAIYRDAVKHSKGE